MTHSSHLMNSLSRPLFRLGLLVGIVALALPTGAQNVTQTVTLTAGWNAVWLETEPTYDTGPKAGQRKAPEDVFTNTAIQTVVTPKPLGELKIRGRTQPARAFEIEELPLD